MNKQQQQPVQPVSDQSWVDWGKERFDAGLRSVRDYVQPSGGEPPQVAVEPCFASGKAPSMEQAVAAPTAPSSSWLLSPEALGIGAAATVAYGAVKAIDNATRPVENRTIVEHNR